MSASIRPRLAARTAAVGLALVLVGCNRGTNVGGEGLLDPGGRVLLSESGRERVSVGRPRLLKAGDSVEVVEGTAKVTLPAGQVIELQPRSVLSFDRGPELRNGDVLVTSSGSTANVRAAGSDVSITGAARVVLAPALRVTVYQGGSTLRSGGRELVVPALRSAEVSLVGLLPGRPSPLVLDGVDPWVDRFLGSSADREAALESRARGFTGQVRPADAGSPAFYSSLLPELPFPAEFTQSDVDGLGRAQPEAPVRAGEVLLGSAVALQGTRGTFTDRLIGAAAFRAEGASWALVAADQQVPSLDDLLRLVDSAVNVAPLELAIAAPPQAAQPSEPPPARATTPTRPAPSRAAPTPTPTLPPPVRRTAPPTTVPPAPAPAPVPTTPPPPLDALLESTVDPVVDLLTDLLGGGR